MIVLFATQLFAESEGNSKWKEDGYLRWISDDGMFEMRLDVRIYIDGAIFFENKNELSNGTHLLRGRFAVKAKLWENWNAEYDIDVADNAVEAKDMWLSYNGLPNAFVKFGHFKVPFSLNELTSSRLLTFMERAYPNVFPPGRRTAVGFTKWGEIANLQYHFSTALFGQEMDNVKNKTKDEAWGTATRLTLAPKLGEDITLHSGGNFAFYTPDDESEEVEFKIEQECKIGDTEFLNTDDIKHVDNVTLMGAEGALRYKNFCLQGEVIQANVKRLEDYEDAQFSGGYGFLSWVITGEERPYEADKGEFGQIIPKNSYGAWELAARYSHLNLSDTKAEIQGGKANNIAFALNWYANPNVRFMLNYIIIDNSEYADMKGKLEGDDDYSLLSARILVFY